MALRSTKRSGASGPTASTNKRQPSTMPRHAQLAAEVRVVGASTMLIFDAFVSGFAFFADGAPLMLVHGALAISLPVPASKRSA